MRVIQLMGVDGDHVGLYITENQNPAADQIAFDEVFEKAAAVCESDDDANIHEVVDEMLEKLGYDRVFADEVTTDKI